MASDAFTSRNTMAVVAIAEPAIGSTGDDPKCTRRMLS